jgi:hypothetical protein
VTMGLDPTLKVSWLYGVPWVALVSLAYFVRRERLRTAADRPVGLGQEAQSRKGGTR